MNNRVLGILLILAGAALIWYGLYYTPRTTTPAADGEGSPPPFPSEPEQHDTNETQ